MIIRFKKSDLFLIICSLLLTLFIAITILTIGTEDYPIGILGIIIDSFILFAMWCRFFAYGLRITTVKIIAIDQHTIKILPYNRVKRITVNFTRNSVSAIINTLDNEEFIFAWDSLFLGTHIILPKRNKISITPDFIKKSISALSECDKVRIQNNFD